MPISTRTGTKSTDVADLCWPAGRKTAHLNGKLYKFTSEKASEAGKKGGAKTAENREHMASIGQKGGLAKRGWRAKEEPAKTESSPESPTKLTES